MVRLYCRKHSRSYSHDPRLHTRPLVELTMIDIDRSEPLEVVRLIDQAVDCQIVSLNDEGFADYRWTGELPGWAGRHIERKTWQNLVSELDDVEDLIRRQIRAHPNWKHTLLIEGTMEPAPLGVLLYRKAQGKNIMTGVQAATKGSFSKVYGWLNQASKYTEVIPTASMAASAIALVCMYKGDQEPEDSHLTFRRNFKRVTWNPNPQVTRLLGAASNDTNIGVKTAEEIIKEFPTLYKVVTASPEQLAKVKGVGIGTAKTFLRSVGRLDI